MDATCWRTTKLLVLGRLEENYAGRKNMRHRPTLMSITQFSDPAIIVFDVECMTYGLMNVTRCKQLPVI